MKPSVERWSCAEIRLLLLAMAVVTLAALTAFGAALYSLYSHSIELQRHELINLVLSQKRLINSVATYDKRNLAELGPEAAFAATYAQIHSALLAPLIEDDAHPIEEVYAQRDGEEILFVMSDKLVQRDETRRVPWEHPEAWGEPMRRALSGQTGSIIARDYGGQLVVAAYTPLERLGMGLVAKIPLEDLRAHFKPIIAYGAGMAAAFCLMALLAALLVSQRLKRDFDERAARDLLLFDHGPVPYGLLQDGAFIDCNQAHEKITGYDKAEIVGQHPAVFSPRLQPDGRESLTASNEYLLRVLAGETVSLSWQYRRRDGALVDSEITLSPIQVNGRPAALGAVRDVTEEKRRRQELLLRESALQSTYSGVAIIDMQAEDYPVVWHNRSLARMSGYTSDEIIGRNLRFLRGNDTEQPAAREIDEAYREKRWTQAVLRHYRQDGTRYIASVRLDPITDEDGVTTHLVAILRDITDEVEREQRLKVFQRIAEQNPLGIVVTDPNANIAYVNEAMCRLTGYAESELLGKNPRVLNSGEHPPSHYRALWETITHGDIWRGELTNRKKNGELFWTVARIAPIRDRDGNITHFVAIQEDVTEKRRIAKEKDALNEQLMQLQRIETIGTLAGGIAHDFNNVIGVIRGWAELAQRHAEGRNDILEDLDHIVKATERSAELVRKILTFSRQHEHQHKRFSLAGLVRESCDLLHSTIPASIDLRCDISTSHSDVVGDSGQVQQALINLCTNAAHAMRSNHDGVLRMQLQVGHLTKAQAELLDPTESKEWLALSVSDNGEGMDEEIARRIFEPFFTTKPVGEGTGMGLAVAFGIAKSHGGLLFADSTPGIGSTFTLLLPRVQGRPHVPGWHDDPFDLQSGDERILLVDDESEILALAERHLCGQGYAVTACLDSSEALDLIQRQPDRFDLLVSDQLMPQHTGMDLIKEYRLRRPGMPALLVSGQSGSVDEQALNRLTRVELLAKPYSLGDLAAAVRRLLDSVPTR